MQRYAYSDMYVALMVAVVEIGKSEAPSIPSMRFRLHPSDVMWRPTSRCVEEQGTFLRAFLTCGQHCGPSPPTSVPSCSARKHYRPERVHLFLFWPYKWIRSLTA